MDFRKYNFNSHAPGGERDIERSSILLPIGLTMLRGERDMLKIDTVLNCFLFHAHTLRGKRDTPQDKNDLYRIKISTHTLRGESELGLIERANHEQDMKFQLTRCRGERDEDITGIGANFDDAFRTHTLRGERTNYPMNVN